MKGCELIKLLYLPDEWHILQVSEFWMEESFGHHHQLVVVLNKQLNS